MTLNDGKKNIQHNLLELSLFFKLLPMSVIRFKLSVENVVGAEDLRAPTEMNTYFFIIIIISKSSLI